MEDRTVNDQLRAAQRKRETRDLNEALKKNEHALVVMMPNEFMEFLVIAKKRQGLSNEQIIAWLDQVIENAAELPQAARQQWQQQKARLKNVGSFLPAISDSHTLMVLAREMARGGHILSKYRVNTYAGRSYVVLKGYAGLRNQLNGTRYLINNPKIVSMGIGKLGAAKAIKGGVVISIIFSVAFHALEQLMNDRATWHDFVAGVTVDVASSLIGAGIAWGAVSAVVGATAMAAIGPIALVVVVGAGITLALNALNEHYQITERLAGMLKEAEANMRANLREMQYEINRGLNFANEDPIGFLHRMFGIPYFNYR